MGNLTTNTAALALLLTFIAAPALAKSTQTTKAASAKTTSAKPAPAKAAAAIPYWKSVVAKVAEQEITREDLLHLIQIEQAYGYPLSESDALMTAIKDAITHEVAHSVGVEITATETPQHFPIVDQHTPGSGTPDSKLIDTLPADQQPFHVDHNSYAKLYVVPRMLERKLRNFYGTASDLHPAEQEHIEQALQLALSGKSFSEAAKATGTATAQHELTEKEIELTIGLEQRLPANRNLPKNALFATLNQLPPGKVLPNILEDESGFRVIRLIEHHDSTYNIETIEVAKPTFESWLRNRARSLSIAISDEKLKSAVKLEHPNIEWVSRL